MKFFQIIIDRFYRYPKSNFEKIKRFGGFISYFKMFNNQKRMINASKFLPPILSHNDGYPIYFLTGENYLYQTLFCTYSLVKYSNEKFQFVLVDDGSFDEKLILRIKKQMPGVKIITAKEIQTNLDERLPMKHYPYLHYKRKIYPHIKKLTDIHTITSKHNKLVLDSDMLFLNEPTEIIDWIKNPNGSIHMIDCGEAYGYSQKLMETLCGNKIPELVNVGILGLNSNSIDWNKLEHWAKKLEETEGASYFLEQALSSMIISNQIRVALDKETYVVNPSNDVHVKQAKTLEHYVDLSKLNYFMKKWKLIIE